MKAFFSPSFATKLSIYVLSFTLIVFVCIMILFYNYSRKQITEDAIDHAHGLLRNTATQISGELQIVESTLEQSVWIVEKNLSTPDSLKDVLTAIVKNNSLIVGSGIAFIPGYYKEKGKYFMPYAFSINEGAEEIVNYLKLGGADYDYPCMDWYLITSEKELLERTLLRHGRRKYNYEYIRATSSQPTRRGICHIYGQHFPVPFHRYGE